MEWLARESPRALAGMPFAQNEVVVVNHSDGQEGNGTLLTLRGSESGASVGINHMYNSLIGDSDAVCSKDSDRGITSAIVAPLMTSSKAQRRVSEQPIFEEMDENVQGNSSHNTSKTWSPGNAAQQSAPTAAKENSILPAEQTRPAVVSISHSIKHRQ
eukprot:CAMPEP_0194663338 /NCGR_PEP_ID=MMETSP0295-20121207/766_1 /TAXON_ID=39354 /ORGANISM="Heterosigma akashiwo, Strain CCMP2393" /LENGTH=157 /DNA_ID=CAMNT_0039544789 /DNA_START=37 /DNA_END=510 /DNA_ORIENTATION=+